MSKKIDYRKQILQIVEALLEGTPPDRVRAKHAIQSYKVILSSEEKEWTLDAILWGSFFTELADSFLGDHEPYLQDSREKLLGNNLGIIKKTVFRYDYRDHFTIDDNEWYTQLASLLQFLLTIPFERFHTITEVSRQNHETWETMSTTIPEMAQVKAIEKEYQKRKSHIEEIIAQYPLPDYIGNEKIYHYMLREATSVLISLQVGKPAVYIGYPIPNDSSIEYIGEVRAKNPFNMTESLQWVKRILSTLAGEEFLFVSWRINKLTDTRANTLLISMH